MLRFDLVLYTESRVVLSRIEFVLVEINKYSLHIENFELICYSMH